MIPLLTVGEPYQSEISIDHIRPDTFYSRTITIIPIIDAHTNTVIAELLPCSHPNFLYEATLLEPYHKYVRIGYDTLTKRCDSSIQAIHWLEDLFNIPHHIDPLLPT
jgi:hypothetical protein